MARCYNFRTNVEAMVRMVNGLSISSNNIMHSIKPCMMQKFELASNPYLQKSNEKGNEHLYSNKSTLAHMDAAAAAEAHLANKGEHLDWPCIIVPSR